MAAAWRTQVPSTNNMRNPRVARNFEALPQPGTASWGMYPITNTPISFNSDNEAEYRWCYLGEITTCSEFSLPGPGRIALQTKDQADKTITIAFYNEDRGNGIPKSLTKPGNTVLVMKAVQHVFMDGRVGIRVDEGNEALFFGMTLEQFLTFSDRLPVYVAAKRVAVKTCHNCQRKGTDLKYCARCHLAWYCNLDCQKANWADRHSRECTIIESGELQSLLDMNWAEWSDSDLD